MKVRISLDTQLFKTKPNKIETAVITKRIANHVEEIEVEKFANYVVQPYGRSFSCAIFNNGIRNNSSWKNQQVFALDIDNGISIDDILLRCKSFNLLPAFIYSTFSATEKNDRFRVIFILNEIIEDIRVRNLIQKALMVIFPESDPMTRDAARLLYGGKNIIYGNFENIISVPSVYMTVCSIIRNGANPSRDMRQFCKSVGVDILNGYPKISIFNNEEDVPMHDDEENIYNSLTKKSADPLNNNSICMKNSHLNYIIYFSKNNTKNSYIMDEGYVDRKFEIEKTNTKKRLIRNYPFNDLYENCKLYRESIQGKYWLYHNEMFGVMTNLLQIEGGSAKIKDIINSRPEYSDKLYSWNAMKNQILKADYSPCQCYNFCPFINQCAHGANMVLQGKLIRGMIMSVGDPEVKSLRKAEKELTNIFKTITDNNNKDISVIKAPTGIGKTQLYIDACKDRNLTIAVPTHKLKDEVSNRLSAEGITHYVIPELPHLDNNDIEKLERLYATGSYHAANIFLKKLAKDNNKVNDYLSELNKVHKIKNKTIVTTHQKILNYKDFNDTVIIDEDIIINAMFPMDMMSIGDLVKINGVLMNIPNFEAGNKIITNILNEVNNAPEGIIQKTPSYFTWFAREIEKIIVNDKSIKTNIIGFLNSSFYVKFKNNDNIENIVFISRQELPQNKKIIILSATINESIAKKVFGESVNFYDIGFVEQCGEILQIPYKSYSKNSIKQDYEGMKNVAVELIKRINPNSSVITFKGFFNDICDHQGWNFFNTAGRDELTGKNVTVIGTPHINPLRYFLFSNALGYKVRIDDCIMSYQPVSKGNYRFYFQTYSNKDFLREIQFYMIESELMQAIGRARTLRNNCRVLVLSNYPIPGAKFIHIDKNELKKFREGN